MKFFRALIVCVVATAAVALEKPKAAPGFKWKSYKEAHCEIQVPDGWFEEKRSASITCVVRLSPEKIVEGRGIDTGFTINVVKCSSQQDWAAGIELAGQVMADARKATEHPISSRVEDTGDMIFMVVEGERLIPDSPHPGKKYHVRAIVRAFPKFATIYMYSFGAPADKWEEAWKKGGVMFSPVWFTLSK